jgi:hypothetical protein
MAGINEGVEYLKSVPSVLKILEIVRKYRTRINLLEYLGLFCWAEKY